MDEGNCKQSAHCLEQEARPLHHVHLVAADEDAMPARVKRRLKGAYDLALSSLLARTGRRQ